MPLTPNFLSSRQEFETTLRDLVDLMDEDGEIDCDQEICVVGKEGLTETEGELLGKYACPTAKMPQKPTDTDMKNGGPYLRQLDEFIEREILPKALKDLRTSLRKFHLECEIDPWKVAFYQNPFTISKRLSIRLIKVIV